ncbi:MAG: FAD-dependent oxidoreductase [Pseudomonadota bacterium]
METDVLIVGGGLAGLTLADHLTRAGIEFLLVEAQSRLGGRILTEQLSGGQFDLGPAWFWPGQPRMADLVQRFSLPVFEQYSSGDLMFQDQTGTVQRGRGYASMQGSLRLDGGLGQLISALGDTIDQNSVFLDTRLVSLSREAGYLAAGLERSGTPFRVRAKQVVLAIPPRVAAETIAVEPRLEPEQIGALKQIPTWMAGQAKILAVYDQPYWRNAGLSGDALSQRGPMVEIHDASPKQGGPYALFGFVGVPADARAGQGATLLGLAKTQLAAMFGKEMAKPIDLVIKDWASVPGIATTEDRAPVRNHPIYGLPSQLRAIWDGKLHLASTETAQGFGGFLEGALEAAERTAHDLARPVSSAA